VPLPADISIDGVRIGCSYWENALLSEDVSRSTIVNAKLIPRAKCKHEHVGEGWAYMDFYDEHWPVRVCLDCRTLVGGRDPHPARQYRHLPAWELTPEVVIARRWETEWPKKGRPRAKKPPAELAWPDAA
jgi:hypothetical protein